MTRSTNLNAKVQDRYIRPTCLDSWSPPNWIQWNSWPILTKETAHDIYTGSLSALSVVSYSDAVKISASIASKSWQTKWERDTSGFYTRHLIPEVGTKVTFPDKRDVGISYCRLLLHDRSQYILRRTCRRCRPVISAADIGFTPL